MSPDLIVSIVFGVIFISVLLVIALVVKEPTPFQIFVFRVVLALAAGAFGAVIPGLIEVKVTVGTNLAIRAAGALALFVIVYKVNPPNLLAQASLKSKSFKHAALELAGHLESIASSYDKPGVQLPGNFMVEDRKKAKDLAQVVQEKSPAASGLKANAILTKLASAELGPDASGMNPYFQVTVSDLRSLRQEILQTI